MNWKPIKGALTAPVGMRWWNNGESRFGGNYRHELRPESQQTGEGISQPILIDHKGGITMDKLRDYFSSWEGLEVIGHIDFEKIWKEAVRINDSSDSEKPNNSTISILEQVETEPQTERSE